ncbi:hypothetical protein ACFFV7_45210 [Nonomuraea spiralis]|uniref:Uncharacterized protein n=1 Tax=Nonomuraea spiralis TaxID=46182 RepID=A0ABV5IW06_9ACTN|nr:hypothetical protein [Nonomuraea spiralis]GGS82593.1 hypothetical protein GCM10010176_027600 [Nonomuraea spiralis]
MKRTLLPLALVAACLTALPAPATAAVTPQLTDTFERAHDTHPTYGLNDSLAARQSGKARGVTYSRVSGSWTTTTPPEPYYSQVNHPDYPGKLSFALARSAVRLDAPLDQDQDDAYTVSVTVDPDPKLRGTEGDWSSVMLSRSPASVGYVTSGDVQLGLTVARNGEVQLFRAGNALWSSPLKTTRAADGFRVTLAVTGASKADPSVAVTVNGVGRTTGLGTPVPKPYLYLGAYVSNDKQVSTADDLAVSRVSRFADTFDEAQDTDPGYGLNDALAKRQPPLGTSTYTRVSGDWQSFDSPPPYYSQVNHPEYPGKLSFALRRSAVRLDAPVAPGKDDAFTVSVTVDPDPKLRGTEGDWSSVMLSQNRDSSGYVTNGDVRLGLTVARNGEVQLFRAGNALWSSPLKTTRAADGFRVTLAVTGASKADPSVTVTVNGVGRTTGLGTPVPKPYLYLGAYVSNDKQVSTADDLAVSRVDLYPNLEYFGYFATDALTKWGNHLPEVTGFANLHWVSVSPDWDTPGSGYRIADLVGCPPRSCALYVGEEFFPAENCKWSGPCPIDASLRRWKAFVEMVKPYKDRIGAIYLKDEPQGYGVTNADLQTMATAVKESMGPGKGFGPYPIMLTLAGGDVKPNTLVPAEVDWVGVDEYTADEARLDSLLTTIERMTGGTKRTYLFPPTEVAPYTGRYDTNEKIEAVQQIYYSMARKHPSMIAIMNFGVWVVTSSNPATHPYMIPRTWDTQERYGVAVTVKD